MNLTAKFNARQVEGIKGTYIANIEVEGGAYGATVISFDKGAEWMPLTAPTLDLYGVPLNCFPVSNEPYSGVSNNKPSTYVETRYPRIAGSIIPMYM